MTDDAIVQVKRLRTIDELRTRLSSLGIDAELEELTVDPDVKLNVNLTGTSKLRFADLTSGLLGSNLSVSAGGDPSQNDLSARISARARALDLGVGSIDLGNAEVTLTWADINQPSTASVTATAPLPVATSQMSSGCPPAGRGRSVRSSRSRSMPRSTSSSVSGRGINARESTLNASPWNSLMPRMYATGSPSARLATNPRNAAA